MSKLISIRSLTRLRNYFRNMQQDNINYLQNFSGRKFDFSGIELIDAPEYPDPSDEALNRFYLSFRNDPKSEFELARILYENLNLTPAQAANNQYWVYLNLNFFFEYIKQRWLKGSFASSGGLEANEIDRYFLTLESSQNSLIRSPIAGLWWSIHLTFDYSKDDKYYYSKIFLSDRNLRDKNFGPYQFIRCKTVFKPLLEFYDRFKDEEFQDERIGSEAIAQQASRTLNQLGGLTLLSYLTKNQVYDLLIDNKELIMQRALSVKIGKRLSREKIQSQPPVPSIIPLQKSYDAYFALNGDTGEYFLSSSPKADFQYNIGLELNNPNFYLIHVYEDGKIKKTNLSQIKPKIRSRKIDWFRPFLNGKARSLRLHHCCSINEPVIFGLSFMVAGITYVKLFDSDDNYLFRNDCGTLHNEGRKVLYTTDYVNFSFKILPIDLKNKLSSLFKSPLANGTPVNNPRYEDEKLVLQKAWPELFNS